MADEVDGGYAISTTASADRGSLSFNNIRPFSFNSSVLISTMKRTGSTGEVCITGFVEDKSNSNSGSYDHLSIRFVTEKPIHIKKHLQETEATLCWYRYNIRSKCGSGQHIKLN